MNELLKGGADIRQIGTMATELTDNKGKQSKQLLRIAGLSFALTPGALEPPPLAKCRKINARRGIPPLGAITGTELQSDLLVSVRNSQWRPA